MTLRGRLLLALAYVLLLAIIALEVPLALSLRERVDTEVTSQARSQADVVAATVGGDLDRPKVLAETVRTASEAVRGRVVVTDLDGALLADSAGTDRLGTDYGDRPEIAKAISDGANQDQRHSDTLDQEILATAVPVVEGGTKVGVVRITQSVEAVSRATRRAILGLAAIGLLVLALGLAAGIVIARQIAGPLRRLDDAAARVAEGDLTVRAKVEGSAEQRSLARTFNGMTARLERLVAGQRDFVADASHQLRTPLSGLKLRLEEARAATDDPEVHEEVDAADAELDRLAAIISELLVLSQAGEVDAPPEELDLDDAAARAAARHDGTERGRVEAVRAASGAPAFAPPADLDRVLDALIENALRYGGGRVTVVARAGGLEVLDEGPGLAGNELEAVFERFHRGRAGRAGPAGTGLGLPIARELARRWGGDVELANRPEGGAVARITVPAPTTVGTGMNRSVVLWCLAAVAGVVLVAGVTYAASGLSTQTIGLSSEPLSAGDDLSPEARRRRPRARRRRRTAPPPAAAAARPPPRRRAPPPRQGARRGHAAAHGRPDRRPDDRRRQLRLRRRQQRQGPRPGPGRRRRRRRRRRLSVDPATREPSNISVSPTEI